MTPVRESDILGAQSAVFTQSFGGGGEPTPPVRAATWVRFAVAETERSWFGVGFALEGTMDSKKTGQVGLGYVLKTFPRLSQTFVLRELEAHERAGLPFEVFVLRPEEAGVAKTMGVSLRAPVHRLLVGGPRDASVRTTADPRFIEVLDLLVRHVRRTGTTHLHAHFASLATTICRLAAHEAGIRYSFTAHARDIFHRDVDEEDLRSKILAARCVVTISGFNRDHLVRLAPEAAPRIHVIYNGIDVEQITYACPAVRPRRIVAVGRLIEKKGFEDLLEAMALLEKRGVDFEGRIVGEGPDRGRLEDLTVQRGLAHRVRFMGELSPTAVQDEMRSASVHALPCVVGADGDRDGLPTVILEAMALGTPCVSTPVTGIPEAVRDQETGLLVPERSPHALALACARLLDDAALRAHLSRQARSLVEERFDLHRNAAAFRSVLGLDAPESNLP